MYDAALAANARRADFSLRTAAWIAGVGLLLMAVLAPFAKFFVLQNIVVPADAAATLGNIVASERLFRSGIAAFFVVAVLDVVVAWALYLLLRSVNESIALLTAWLRLAFAAVFMYSVANLVDAVGLVSNPLAATMPPEQLRAQVMSSIAAFDNGWQVGLAVFGIHLLGIGYLVFRLGHVERYLGALVVLAGLGYLTDSIGLMLVPHYSWTVGVFTFIGEALLIPWLFWVAIRGGRAVQE